MICDKCKTPMDERAAQIRFGYFVCTTCDTDSSDAEFCAAMGLECSVMLHGFTNLECGSQEHCDSDSDECDGFNVWVRVETPHDNQQPFDSIDSADCDFDTLDAAREYAAKLCAEYGEIDHDEY